MRKCNWMSEWGLWCRWRRLNVHIKDWTRVVCAVSSHMHRRVTIAFQTLEFYHVLKQDLKKGEKKKKDIKESFERSALGASHSPGLPAMGRCCPCCHHGGNMAGLPGTAEAPHGDVSWKARSQAVHYSSQIPSLHSWNDRGAHRNQSSRRVALCTHVLHLGTTAFCSAVVKGSPHFKHLLSHVASVKP